MSKLDDILSDQLTQNITKLRIKALVLELLGNSLIESDGFKDVVSAFQGKVKEL